MGASPGAARPWNGGGPVRAVGARRRRFRRARDLGYIPALMATHKVRKAVIPAAGLGTRFLPATKAVPKEMLPIVDTPTIQYIVAEAVAAGVRDVILVCARGKE